MSSITPKISPFLWFDSQAEQAAEFYVSVFPDSRILDVTRYPEGTPMPVGSAMTVSFELAGQRFTALNGGPSVAFTEATSFWVNCETQEEVDAYWEKLSDGGKEIQCGWVTDRFGLTWQIVPALLMQLMSDPDPARAQRTAEAMMKMVKFDIAELQRAADAD